MYLSLRSRHFWNELYRASSSDAILRASHRQPQSPVSSDEWD